MINPTPYEQVNEAAFLWTFSVYIFDGVINGLIPPNLIKRRIVVNSLSPKFYLDASRINLNMNSLAINNLLASSAICAIAIDSALDEAFGDKPDKYSDKDIDSLRAIVYMIRCAFAHNPLNPKWVIKSKYRRVFSIKEIGLKVDLTDLDDIPVHPDHHGGWEGFNKILLFSLKILREKYKGH